MRLEGAAAREVERLDERRLAVLLDRIDADLALGRHSQLVSELEALVAEQPLHERLRAQLMLALYRSGRQADALALYRATRALLAEELGLEPSAELQRLERQILVHDQELEPAGAGGELHAGRAAAERRAWHEAFELLAAADARAPLGPEDLERLGKAAFWSLGPRPSIDPRVRSYAGYVDAHAARDAARMALALANCCRWLGAGSMGAGWLNRAERLLAAEPEAVEHGYLDLARARSAEASAEFERSYEVAAATAELARRHGDRSVEALALHQMGYVRIWAGELDEGWALVDEATAAAVAGELTPHATATIYCGTISACRDLADFRRAAEWTEHVARWCERNARTGFPGICRLHRAEVMKLRGALAQAEEEVLVACRELADFNVSAAGSAFYELGEVRLRLGAFAAAEEAFQQAHELGREPQPGLALLRLAHGEAERARSCIARALAETEESLARVWLLPAAVDIELAAGDVERAEAAARELQEIGERYSSPLVLAGASCAAGAVALARGRANAARESLRVGRRIWQDLDAPYEAGQARVRLALAYRAAGDEEAARLELGSARSTFVRLGAVPALQTVEALLEPELTARPGT